MKLTQEELNDLFTEPCEESTHDESNVETISLSDLSEEELLLLFNKPNYK